MKRPVELKLRCRDGSSIRIVLEENCNDVGFGKDLDPEKIKLGLMCCGLDKVSSCNCPYGENCDDFENMQKLKHDALDYIEELEVECGRRSRGKPPEKSVCNSKYYFVKGLPWSFDPGERLIADMCLYDEPQYVAGIDRMAWGWVLMDRPLTVDVMHKYGMISAPVE